MALRGVPEYWRLKKHRYRLIGGLCRDCGQAHYPPMPRCPYCGSGNLVEVSLPRRGRLVSYTVLYSAPSTAKDKAPLLLGLVELGSVRLIAEITDAQPDSIRTGIEVEPVLRRLGEDGASGVIYYAIKFRPVLKPSGEQGG